MKNNIFIAVISLFVWFFIFASVLYISWEEEVIDENDYSDLDSSSFYDLSVMSIDWWQIDFSDYKWKNLLLVNTASQCWYTYQYEWLQELHMQYSWDLQVIWFPSDNFAGQEFEDDEDIQEFCDSTFWITFPLSTRIDVVWEDQHDIYNRLTNKEYNWLKDSEIEWNFQKYFVNREWELVDYFLSETEPMDDEILELIQ